MPLTIVEMQALTEKCVRAATRAWDKLFLANGEAIAMLSARMLAYYLKAGVKAEDIGDFPPEEKKK